MTVGLLTLIVTVVLFLLGQLLVNIAVLSKLNTRVTRIETHMTHVLRAYHAALKFMKDCHPPQQEPPP